MPRKLICRNSVTRSSAEWREIGGKRKYFRSRWEANYAFYLQFLKEEGHIQDWFHEPKTFWFEGIKRGVNNYKPDFQIIKSDGSSLWAEVKGYMDSKSQTKIKRFKKYFPEETLIVIDKKWFAQNNPKMRLVVKDWES